MVITISDEMRFYTSIPGDHLPNAAVHPSPPAQSPGGSCAACPAPRRWRRRRHLAHFPTPATVAPLRRDAQDGGERFFSTPERHRPITIIINTAQARQAPRLKLESLVELAFDNPPPNVSCNHYSRAAAEGRNYRKGFVARRRRPSPSRGGTIVRVSSIPIES